MIEIIINYTITVFVLVVILSLALAIVFLCLAAFNCFFSDKEYDPKYLEWTDTVMFFSLLALCISIFDDD